MPALPAGRVDTGCTNVLRRWYQHHDFPCLGGHQFGVQRHGLRTDLRCLQPDVWLSARWHIEHQRLLHRRFGIYGSARTIANGANILDYNLYTSTARTTVWGDGTGATSTVAGSGAGLLTASTQTVYGRVSASQDKPAGTYTSTITVTVTF
jgi:hypothetical protein